MNSPLTRPCPLCDGPAHGAEYCARCQVRLADRIAGARAVVYVLCAVAIVALGACTVFSQFAGDPSEGVGTGKSNPQDKISACASRPDPVTVGENPTSPANLAGKASTPPGLSRPSAPVVAGRMLVVGSTSHSGPVAQRLEQAAYNRQVAGSMPAGTSIVTPEFLDRLAWLESRNNPAAVGKAGELGAYQLRPVAVREVNRVFGLRLQHRQMTNSTVGREAARLLCQHYERRLTLHLRRSPNSFELREAYRRGVTGFIRWRKTV